MFEVLKDMIAKMYKTNLNDEHMLGLIDNAFYKLYYEKNRLTTFTDKWPHTFIDKNLLAKTGFYYTGKEDIVQCVFCQVELSKWTLEDNEVFEHMKWSPNCPLLKRQEIKNVSLDPMMLTRILPPISYDECGIYKSTNFNDQAESSISYSNTLQSSQSSLNNGKLENIFFISESKSIAFVFIRDNQEQFKLQNVNNSNYIHLTKETMRHLFSTIKTFLNINIQHPNHHINETDFIKNKMYIYLVNKNTCKIQIDKKYVDILMRDLVSILDVESLMPLIYINYLD